MGHYCRVCECYRSNEKFSGKGHKNHICKKCSKLSIEVRNEKSILNKIHSFSFYGASKKNRKIIESYLNNKSEKVRELARSVIEEQSRVLIEYSEQNDIDFDDKLSFEEYISSLDDEDLPF